MLRLSHFAYRMGAYEYLQRSGFQLVSGKLWIAADGETLATLVRVGAYDYRVTYG